jgi:hypothetical protein
MGYPMEYIMLYHKETGIPGNVQKWISQSRTLWLSYSQHAKQEASNEGINIYNGLPDRINLNKCELVECELVGQTQLAKIVVRTRYNQSYDLVLVIIPAMGVVKTVWLNHRADTHATLNRSKYTPC